MAEMIMDGLGSANNAIVDNDHRLWTNVSGTVAISGAIAISGTMTDSTLTYKQLIDYEDQYQPRYIGLALPGTGSESAEWMLRKYLYSTNDLPIATLFGSGNTNFDKKWSERSGIYEAYS